mgnify:CR=1 FL=1
MAVDFEALKREDCRKIARRLGLELNRQDKVRCFLHAGDTNPSLQVYADGWKCFGCGEHGDAVDLVSKYQGISKVEAAEWIQREMGIREPAPKKGIKDYGVLEREHIYPGGQVKKAMYRCADGSKYGRWFHLEDNTWKKGRGNAPHSLYIAGELSGALFICEGEKDADSVHRLGFNAVSSEDGAGPGKWRKEYTEQLRGLPVAIFQDNDPIGRDYAQETAAALHGVASSVKVLDLSKIWPEVPEHGDISDLIGKFGDEKSCDMIAQLLHMVPEWEPEPKGRSAKAAATFGEDKTSFLWFPYLPIGDYSVMMADGGTGKTILCCGIAANVTRGKPLPGDEFSYAPQNVLIISAEDRGELLSKRLARSGADLDKVFILDCIDSEGMNFSDGYEEFTETVLRYRPALVIIDPWHAFLGANVDMNRVNAIRPVFQKLANLAKRCNCSLLLISHVNKRAQGENANNAATGSSDFINAARSAMRVIFDEGDEDCRIMVHTKTNYARYGQSVRYRIVDGGVQWEGFSEITRQTLESAARHRATPWEVMQKSEERESVNSALVEALEKSANQFAATRFSYDEFKQNHGDLIFGGMQPKRALDAVKDRLSDDGYYLRTGIQVKKNGVKGNGFLVQRIESTEPEQIAI